MNSFDPYNSPFGVATAVTLMGQMRKLKHRQEMICPESQLVGGGAGV